MNSTQPTVKIGSALFLAACAVAILVHRHPERLRVPERLALFAVGLLGFAGICIAAQALRLHGLVRSLVCVLLGAMAMVPAWIAFGSGSRQCTLVWLGGHAAASEVVCRGAFGAGAVILAGMFIVAVRDAARSWRGPTTRPCPRADGSGRD